MESGLNSDTVQVEVLPEDIVAAPVFVDSTGKRRRRLRTVGFLAGGVAVAYAAMLGLSFAGGPVAPNALLPIPGVPTVAPLAAEKDKKPEGSLSAVSSDQEISRGDNGNRGDRIDATSTTTPGLTPSGTAKAPLKPSAVTPTPTKASPTPSATKPSPTPSPTKASPTPPPTTKPADPPPVTTKPADPPATTKPADPPPVTTKPADPPVTTKPADPPANPAPGTGAGGGGSGPTKPADPPATTKPADPPATTKPADPPVTKAPTTKAPTVSTSPSTTTES